MKHCVELAGEKQVLMLDDIIKDTIKDILGPDLFDLTLEEIKGKVRIDKYESGGRALFVHDRRVLVWGKPVVLDVATDEVTFSHRIKLQLEVRRL